ncbi:MAG TPA: hypothetical protein PKA37_13365, partial [Planctomycetota bacterium]|nr:hypothetical protein [Planctomycetota bacterium]
GRRAGAMELLRSSPFSLTSALCGCLGQQQKATSSPCARRTASYGIARSRAHLPRFSGRLNDDYRKTAQCFPVVLHRFQLR